MLLNELTGVKNLKHLNAFQILKLLQKHHGVKFAAGSYGMVLSHPSMDQVLKFTADKAYMMFLEYVANNKGNPHLPIIKKKPQRLTAFFSGTPGVFNKDISKHLSIPLEKLYVVRIEKLEPIKSDMHKICNRLASNIYEYIRAKEAVNGDEYLEKRELTDYKSVMETLVELEENLPGRVFLDLNYGNWMMRGKTLVISDPYAAAQSRDRTIGYELEDFMDMDDIKDIIKNYDDKTVDQLEGFTNRLFKNLFTK